MECLEMQQVCGWTRCSGSAFSLPEICGYIAVYIMICSFLHFCGHCQDIVTSHQACQSQVAVIDSAVRIGKGNQLILNPRRKTLSPQEWGNRAARRGKEVYTPFPVPAASHAPMVAGTGSGINSAIFVSCVATSLASKRKSSRRLCNGLERFKCDRVGSSCWNASCSNKNRPTEPGSTIDIERSSPSTLCQTCSNGPLVQGDGF